MCKDVIKGCVSIELCFCVWCKLGSREGVSFSFVSLAFRGGVFILEFVCLFDGVYDFKFGSVV